MSNIRKAFENGKAFVPFVTCGDPNLEVTQEIIFALVRAGADLIELGIPFSDPTAEGPTIQDSNFRALAGGVSVDKIFDLVRETRKRAEIPLAFMTYANVPFSYGVERFAKRCGELGVDGLLLPDVPFEESAEFAEPCAKNDVDLISMVAPTSEDRIAAIAAKARGFLYCVSSYGVTGTRANISTSVSETVRRAKRANPDLPCAIGFGISTPEQAKAFGAISDGVVVGSAIVNICASRGADCVAEIEKFARTMKKALR